ncbi:MAG: hypothetical protein P8R42_07860 [Candidatus Binatia bacterium]|nr:hypothetical protein [Candidatus Binatia bacterium]
MLVFLVASLSGGLVGCSGPEPTAEKASPPAAEPAEPAKPAPPTEETVCDDGKDDDADGKSDCDDRDCSRSTVCKIERCKEVCAAICECELISEVCSEKELAGVLEGCQASCSDEKTRSQVSQADGVPCFVIGGVFLQQVQKEGICLGDDTPGDGA